MVLVESYQNGHLLQARATLKKSLSKQFVEVTEQDEIERLTKLYERFTVSDKNLEGRFTFFVKNLEDAECIDDLVLSANQQRAKKADFFFDNRSFISELKSLKTDTAPKVERILEPYKKMPEWPIYYGSVDLRDVLKHLPNRDEINAKVVEGVTDGLEGIIESANRQIRTTKETFNLPDSEGILIILNDVVDTLTPELIRYRIYKCLRKKAAEGTLRKKTTEGNLRFPHIAIVIVITTLHYTRLKPDLKAHPIMIIPGNSTQPTKLQDFVDLLVRKWSAFDRRPLIKVDSEEFLKRSFTSRGSIN